MDAPTPPAFQPLAKVQRSAIDVSLEDRWLLLGTTGSGKTRFAKELTKRLHAIYPDTPVYILDSKALDDFTEWYSGLVQGPEIPAPIDSGFQVWQPGQDNFAAYDQWFEQLLHTPGPAIVLIDEISSLGKGKGDIAPPGFQKLLKQGRAAGKSVINCTQEYSYVPRQIKNQTTHVVNFRLLPGPDLRFANVFLGRDGKAPPPRGRYGFFYRRTDSGAPAIEYAKFQDFF